jgi:diguanylate cyclase (GGDEF)-like protein
VAVLYLDLDNFKLVNDTMGHHTGDTLLQETAERLQGCTRETDLVARQGGDEFLILLADLQADQADDTIRGVAQRVHEAMQAPVVLGDDVEFRAQGSMGISVFPRDAQDPVELLKNADIAMYRAKRLDPGGSVFFAADPPA